MNKNKHIPSLQLFKIQSWRTINDTLYVYGTWITGPFHAHKNAMFTIIGLHGNIKAKGYYHKEHIIFSENVKDILNEVYEKGVIEYI